MKTFLGLLVLLANSDYQATTFPNQWVLALTPVVLILLHRYNAYLVLGVVRGLLCHSYLGRAIVQKIKLHWIH